MPAPSTQRQQRQQRQEVSKTKYTDLEEGALSGNLTRDPELRFTPEGRGVATMRLAETERVYNEQTQQWGDGQTQFYDVTAWGDMAVNCSEVLIKGDRVAVVGKWQKQEWTADDGEQKTKLVLVARDIGPSLLFYPATIQRDKRKGQPRR